MRLIDADVLWNDLEILYVHNKGKVNWNDALLKIKNAPTIEVPQRWIPVTEELPRDDEDVIVTCLDDSGDTPFSYTTVAWHYNGMWVCENERCPFVIAWMPLPEPYKGEPE